MLFEMMSNITGLGWGGLANTLNSFDSRDSLFKLFIKIYIFYNIQVYFQKYFTISMFLVFVAVGE